LALQTACESADSIERRFNIGQRVGKREPQISFTVSSERRTRQSGNSGFIQEAVCYLLARSTQRGDIGE
jgi:hypothetical protein